MGAVPPPWLAQFMGNINQNFNQMQAGFARIEVQQVNAGILRLNRLEMESNSGLIAYRAKQKVVSCLFLTLDHCHNSSCRLREMVPYLPMLS
jgi:hypothetical protein